MLDHPLFLCYPLFLIQNSGIKANPTNPSFESTQVKNQTYGAEINRAAYHDELYLFDTMLSICQYVNIKGKKRIRWKKYKN